MSSTPLPYPVVDIFAGPGGLGEGFASLRDEKSRPRFKSVASIERDEFSHRTLKLRHFFRSFRNDEVPDEYYAYLKGSITIDDLYRLFPAELRHAQQSALLISLGPDEHVRVRRLINNRLGHAGRWALVGGPPCQAYSLVGRSRMMGNPEFEQDERHFLYREYLKILADHRPPVFVMENVKGLLSAKVNGEPVINRIVSDLSNPRAAIEGRKGGLGYRLYSLSEADRPGEDVDPKLFLVRAEQYGVPQARHRMFIVGIRCDLDVRPRQLVPHPAPSVRETIGNLPKIRSTISRGSDSAERWQNEIAQLLPAKLSRELRGAPSAREIVERFTSDLRDRTSWPENASASRYPRPRKTNYKALATLQDNRLSVLTSHESRGHMPSDLRRYAFAAVYADVTGRSPKLADFPESLLPDHQNVELGRFGKMFSDRFRVQLADEVSTTITSHISKDGHYFIHYDPQQCRSLTVREAARLQTFPDNYSFEGPRTEQYHQVGNAVPPYLASQIAEIIAEVLDRVSGDL